MTWKDIKLATLQKMFSADGTEINVNDESVKEYVNAMPQAANEGMQLLCTAGKYLRRCYEFEKAPGSRMTLDLKQDVPDFYSGEVEVYQIAEDGAPECAPGARVVAGRYLVLPVEIGGKLQYWYNARPQEITLATPDKTEIALDPEVVVLLPLYMAGQLYKEDDAGLATGYRNEFEAALERLEQAQAGVESDQFVSVTNWI